MEDAVENYAISHGGTHQRLARALELGIISEAEVRTIGSSAIAMTLVEIQSYGILQVTWVQQLAQDALDDGIENPELRKIASMGAHGQYQGNLARDLNDAPSELDGT